MSADAESTIPVHEQPDPRQAYRLTMTIEDAPGPFGEVRGAVQYNVKNYRECGRVNPEVGAATAIVHLPEHPWRQIAPNVYETTVHADGLLDEDYYGKGVCHWELRGASALLRATGDKRETRFLPAMDYDEIFAEKTKVLYFWKGGYPRSGMENYPDLGEISIEKYGEDLRKNLFSITLTAKKVQL
ncbi:MAG: hypothetical protein ACTHOH_04165 [Lysobacteraceae bacterium]